MRLLLVPAISLALATVPSVTLAQQTAPPGNAGVDEYVESVPAAGGNRPAQPRDDAGSGGTNGGTSGLTPAQLDSLRAEGADGRALAEVLEEHPAAAPASASPARGRPATVPAGDSPIESVIGAATGGSSVGLGPLLPILLAATLGLFLGSTLVRRRRSR